MTLTNFRIRKTTITARRQAEGKAMMRLLERGKKIKNKQAKKKEEEMFLALITERQSMKREHLMRRLKLYIREQLKKEQNESA